MKYLKIHENFQPITVNVIVDEPDEFKTEFIIGGDSYWFQSRDENKILPESIRYGWHLGFGLGSGEDKYLPTGHGKQFQVFNGVKQSLSMFINNRRPDKMSFIAEGESKANIYVSLLTKFGYSVSQRDSGLDSLTGKQPILFMLDR